MTKRIIVIVNYQTPDLIKRAVDSFRRFYPDESLLLIDNGSQDESVPILKNLVSEYPDKTEILLNTSNIYHGPAMDQALRYVQNQYVAFLDSDCVVLRGGFLESMNSTLSENDSHYIVGRRVFMNRRGFEIRKETNGFPYIRPICMIVKRELYISLPPFQHHGTPCLANMRAASECGYALIDFPVDDYVCHKGRGTAERHGYNLGWRGKWNYLLNKMGL